MKKFFLPALSKAMNAYLQLDPESTDRLHKLENKTVAIEFLPIHFTFQCLFTEKGVVIATDSLQSIDTTIRGTPLQMLGMMFAKENRQRFFSEDLTIEGNAELGQQVVDLFDELQIDWEEYLSHLVGDTSAHHISHFFKKMNTWLTKVESSFTHNINEYVHEEAEWLPTQEALQDFFHEIDTTRMDVDRLEARIKLIQAEELL